MAHPALERRPERGEAEIGAADILHSTALQDDMGKHGADIAQSAFEGLGLAQGVAARRAAAEVDGFGRGLGGMD